MINSATSIVKAIFHYLGSIRFAILLIASTAIIVAIGTVLESVTDSHGYASELTYESWLFSAMLCGFFINILFSALRRYPFKMRHIPFLITHCGLLMIITGQLMKKQQGLQGILFIAEGSGSNKVLLPNTYVVSLTENNENKTKYYFEVPKDKTPFRRLKLQPESPSTDLKLTLMHFSDNTKEELQSFIKADEMLTLLGYPPQLFEKDLQTTAFKQQIALNSQSWNIKALVVEAFHSTFTRYFNDHVSIRIIDNRSETLIDTIPLVQFFNEGLNTPYGNIKGRLSYTFENTWQPTLHVEFEDNDDRAIEIPLQGEKALQNLIAHPSLGQGPLSFDLVALPALLFMKRANAPALFGWTKDGEIIYKPLDGDSDARMIAYDDGYLGYTKELNADIHASRLLQQRHSLDELEVLLMAENDRSLAPPLELFRQACALAEVDFAPAAIEFLSLWDKEGGWLYSPINSNSLDLKKALKMIPWHSLPKNLLIGCRFTAKLFDNIETQFKKPSDIRKYLIDNQFPVSLLPHSEDTLEVMLQKITHQMFAISDDKIASLMEKIDSKDHRISARFLSALFRLYDIHLSMISNLKANVTDTINLEAVLKPHHRPIDRITQIEKETPAIWLRVEQGNHKEVISLAYDRNASAIQWPILNGQFIARFQPIVIEIPHRLRLRQARKITYPDTSQPYSYEADLWIKEFMSPVEQAKTLSMNNVHETTDSYRFYLSNIFPHDDASMKKVQIVVNRDPTKYMLTYPGGILVTLGALLLFWIWPKTKYS